MPATTTARARVAKRRALLARGNSKLGDGIYTWSIPAVDTCPGRTAYCESLCYATKAFFAMRSTRSVHASNLRLAERSDFVARMTADIDRRRIGVVRIHAAGDFHSAAYARKWAEIARACPNTTFYWYTRSWRRPEILPALRELAALPNSFGWFSEDEQTGASPEVPGVRVAYLAGSAAAAAALPPRADLVFVDGKALYPDRTRRLKRVRGALVCPREQLPPGRRYTLPSCSTCRICFTGRALPRKPHTHLEIAVHVEPRDPGHAGTRADPVPLLPGPAR